MVLLESLWLHFDHAGLLTVQVPVNMTACTRKDSILEYFNCIHGIQEVLFRKVLPEVLNREAVYQYI